MCGDVGRLSTLYIRFVSNTAKLNLIMSERTLIPYFTLDVMAPTRIPVPVLVSHVAPLQR